MDLKFRAVSHTGHPAVSHFDDPIPGDWVARNFGQLIRAPLILELSASITGYWRKIWGCVGESYQIMISRLGRLIFLKALLYHYYTTLSLLYTTTKLSHTAVHSPLNLLLDTPWTPFVE